MLFLLILLALPIWAIRLLPTAGLQALMAGWMVALSFFLCKRPGNDPLSPRAEIR